MLAFLAVVTWGLCGCHPDPVDASRDVIELDLSSVPVEIQVIVFADWGAQIDSRDVWVGDNEVSVGGAATLAAYWERDEAGYPGATLIVAGGDSFGASPPLSSFFDEEPAIVALNGMGVDADTFGNHNFDRGVEHLQRMIDLADFSYVAANLTNVPSNLAGVAPYTIRIIGGVPVAIIGLVDEEASALVFPGSLGTMAVTDPVAATLEAMDLARQGGATVFVVLGGTTMTAAADGTYAGPLRALGAALEERSEDIALILGQSARTSVLCSMAGGVFTCQTVLGDEVVTSLAPPSDGGPMVLQTRSAGRDYARVFLTVIPATGEVVSRRVEIVVPVTTGVTPAAHVEASIAGYRTELATLKDQRVTVASTPLVWVEEDIRRGEEPLGNLVADAMLQRAGTRIAVVNGGALGASLPSSYLAVDSSLRRPPGVPPYDVVVGDVDTLIRFNNVVVRQQVSGQEIWEMLENSVDHVGEGNFLHVAGLHFVYDSTKERPNRVCLVILDDGTVIPAGSQERFELVTVDYLAQGGDGYLSLTNEQGTAIDLLTEVVVHYLELFDTIEPPLFLDEEPRITDAAGDSRLCEHP